MKPLFQAIFFARRRAEVFRQRRVVNPVELMVLGSMPSMVRCFQPVFTVAPFVFPIPISGFLFTESHEFPTKFGVSVFYSIHYYKTTPSITAKGGIMARQTEGETRRAVRDLLDSHDFTLM